LTKTVKNIFSIISRQERFRMTQLILLDVVISLLDILFLAGLIFVIHFYTQPDQSIPFSFFPFTFFSSYPLSLIIVFFLLFAAKNGLGYLVFKMQYRFVYAVASRLSKRNLLHYLEGSYNQHVDIDSAVHIHKISHQPVEFGHHVLAGFQQIVGQTILIILTIVAILIYDPLLFLLLFIVLTPPILLIGFLIKRRSNAIRKTAKPVKEKTLQHLQEALAGYIESNIFQRNDYFVNRYITYQARFNDFLSRQLVVQQLPGRFMEVFAVLGLLALIILNYYGNNSGTIQLVTIGAFMAAAYKIIPGIVKILNNIGQIKTYGYTITDLMQSENIPAETNEAAVASITTVAMQHVSFMHKEKEVINNFSLEISKGDFIGLTGISGMGKTTVVNLLLGFLNPDSGKILINNIDTTVNDRQQFRKNIAYVKQDPFIIHDTIATNITLNGSNYDAGKMDTIIRATGLDILTSQYSNGLKSIITENGKNISGGQRQRIAMARALYKNAGLIILDEPFNELDRSSENVLLTHCKELAATGKIIVLITHNTESLACCSKIISMNEN